MQLVIAESRQAVGDALASVVDRIKYLFVGLVSDHHERSMSSERSWTPGCPVRRTTETPLLAELIAQSDFMIGETLMARGLER